MGGYKKYIYVFGGSPEFIPGVKIRVVLGDVWKYSIEKNQWQELHDRSKNSMNRMYAASCVLQGLWLIHGGTSGNLNDILSSSFGYRFGIFSIDFRN